MKKLERRNFLVSTALTLPVVGLAVSPGHARARGGSHRLERHAREWTHAYLAAWADKDGDAAAALFTPDAVYEAIPGVADQTFVGRDAIRDYWVAITAPQQNFIGRHGAPIVQGDKVSVEIWAQWQDANANPSGEHWVTLIEANILKFEQSGLCSRNVEYWNFLIGKIAPPPGWGR